MTGHMAITLATIVLAMVLFAWNRVPAVVIAVCAALVLYLSGVLTVPEALGGFGDPVVILLVALFSIAVALESSGVAAWAGRLLLRHTGGSERRRVLAIMVVAAAFSSLIGMNGTAVAMVPIVAIVAARTGAAPSRLMMPLAVACSTGANLSLLGSPVNVVAATQIDAVGAGPFGFFAWALVGLPQVAGAILIVLALGPRLLPERPAPVVAGGVAMTDAGPAGGAVAGGGAGGGASAVPGSAAGPDAAPAPVLGRRAWTALAILALLVALLSFDIAPPAIAAAICAVLMVLTGVVTVPQLVRGVDWSTCILIGAMIAPAVALTKTGAARAIGDQIVGALGGLGPYAVLAGLFLATAVLSQFISNTSSALVMLPIGAAAAADLHVAQLPLILGVALGASTSFMNPFANAVTVAVYAPGGYRFGDFWRLGLVVSVWTLLVTVAVVPLIWRF